MKKIGFIGLGKLGLPVATVMRLKGFDVMGWDPLPTEWPEYEPIGNWPEGPAAAPRRANSVEELCDHAAGSIIFVAVQTPHEEHLDGTRTNRDIADFDYQYLIGAVAALAEEIIVPTTIAIISTVAPGTIRREILPVANEHMEIVYNPFFIAMGTTVRDFLEPEFILMGIQPFPDDATPHALTAFYLELHDNGKPGDRPPIRYMSYESAELVKMGYNTFITQKINFANWLMQICEAIPEADIDDVMHTLQCSNRRLISTAYLDGGMGDGGACHPRDNIVMEWLSDELKIFENPAQSANDVRTQQARWLADVMLSYHSADMEIIIYGFAYKPGTPLTQGSAALLVANILHDCGYRPVMIDPVVDGKAEPIFDRPAVFLLGCNHPYMKAVTLTPGSVVIDPFRNNLSWGNDVTVVNLGAAR